MTYILRLYIANETPSSQRALENLKEILEIIRRKKHRFKLGVIDILENPQIAENEKILAIPVLERRSPLPVKRFIGDLSNKEEVLRGLGLFYRD